MNRQDKYTIIYNDNCIWKRINIRYKNDIYKTIKELQLTEYALYKDNKIMFDNRFTVI